MGCSDLNNESCKLVTISYTMHQNKSSVDGVFRLRWLSISMRWKEWNYNDATIEAELLAKKLFRVIGKRTDYNQAYNLRVLRRRDSMVLLYFAQYSLDFVLLPCWWNASCAFPLFLRSIVSDLLVCCTLHTLFTILFIPNLIKCEWQRRNPFSSQFEIRRW